MENKNLPHEMLVEIFLRSPAKSVGKCKCLSKAWNTLLSTKDFIDSHLKTQHQKQEQKLILVNERSLSIHMSTLQIKDDRVFSQEISLENNTWPCLLASCNGLVLILLDNKPLFMFVLNPVTREQVVRLLFSRFTFYGFGYDSVSDDYKVVRVGNEHAQSVYVDVYYLKTGVWKTFVNPDGSFGLPNVDDDNYVMPFVNGAVHWLACYSNDVVYRMLAFDLETETFREVQLPNEVQLPSGNPRRMMVYSLLVLKGCLSIAHRLDNYSSDVWMMREYGDVDSWVRFRLDFGVFGRGVMPVCFVGDEEVLCFVESDSRNRVEEDGRCWVVRDLNDGTMKKIAAGRIPFSVSRRSKCCLFVDSLVSPEQGTVPGTIEVLVMDMLATGDASLEG